MDGRKFYQRLFKGRIDTADRYERNAVRRIMGALQAKCSRR
jgi:hypothetical protein